jgi:(1->4)-alpha-D-glucan 1-alpha-D-glucosylmutase
LDATAAAFHRLARSELATRDLPLPALRRALAALIEVFSVYRTYAADTSTPPSKALERAKRADPAAGPALDQIGRWLAGDGDGDLRAEAIRRFEQLSAPVAAKAVEDTAFYRYGRLLSRNDVGFDPGRFSTTPAAFAERAAERGRAFPASLLATATHDHKRGEDVRARLAVLSEMPDAWAEHAKAWLALAPLNGVDPGDAHMLHQMIVGAWPLDLSPDDAEAMTAFADRLADWQRKALREAKLRTSWTVQDEAYETACETYLRRLLTGETDAFRRACARSSRPSPRLASPTAWSRSACGSPLPGVPDLFQGTEFWDFSLVDPDNRRPVDYAARAAALEPRRRPADWRQGETKQALIRRLLGLRRERPTLFAAPMRPLALRGRRAARRWPSSASVTTAACWSWPPSMRGSLHGRGEPTHRRLAGGRTRPCPTGRLVASLTGGAPFWWSID